MQIATGTAADEVSRRPEPAGPTVRRGIGLGPHGADPVALHAGSIRHDNAGHAWLPFLVRIIWVTVKIRMMKARISDSAAP